jgi:DNA-binding transcriptional ArsR family regulator
VTLDAKFRALADTHRRSLVERLVHGPRTVSELAQQMPVSLPSVLKHLAILETGGLVHSAKQGRARIFTLVPDAFADIERWVGLRKQGWNAAFDRLDAAQRAH